MEVIQHLFGACADNHAHLDLTDLAYAGGLATGLYTVRYYIKGTLIIIKQKIWK